VKTLDQDGRKVFINVCGSSRVSLPSSWQHGKVRCVDMRQTTELSTWVIWRSFRASGFGRAQSVTGAIHSAQPQPSLASLPRRETAGPSSHVATATTQMPAEAVQALQRLDRLDDDANEALRFPLSASEAREHPDHLGASATVIDCVFNTSVVRRWCDCTACHDAESRQLHRYHPCRV